MKARTLFLLLSLVAVVIAVAFAVPSLTTAVVTEAAPKAPTDQDMIAHWEKHRKTFDQITEMLRSDPALNRLGLD